ncbi:MAG: cysteine desulfurase family protein [Planctomycetota bacterium]
MNFIYLDYAATTMVDRDIYNEIEDYFFKFFANPSSVHGYGRIVREMIEKEREELARLLGVGRDEIIFCSSGTEANNLAIFGCAYANSNNGKSIISTTVEHSSVLAPLAKLELEGFSVRYLHVDFNGVLQLDDLKNSLTEDTILVSILIVNNETGVIQPYKEISRIIRDFNEKIIIHYDMVAGFPKIITSLNQLDADIITISGHKLYAPKGTAFLYVKEGIKLQPQIVGGQQEFGKRAGTENVPGIIFLCKAIKKCLKERISEWENVSVLKSYFETKLLEKYADNILICGRNTTRIPHISNICFKNKQSRNIIETLSNNKIYVSTGSACKSGENAPSYVISAMGIPEVFSQGSIRFSFGKYTTIEQINTTLDVLYHTINY